MRFQRSQSPPCDASTPYADTGGAAARAALGQLALAAGLYARPRLGSKTLPSVGAWDKEHGLSCPACTHFAADQRPKVVITLIDPM